MYLVGQLPLQILNGRGQIAAAYAELDGNVAASVFAIDHEGAVAGFDIGYLANGYAAPVRCRQQDALNGFGYHCDIAPESGRLDRTGGRLQ